jgi:hypothetical protein
MMFADDTSFSLIGGANNLNTTLQVLNTFCIGSGAKFDWHKMVAIHASDTPRDWDWPEDPGIS